MWCSRCSFGLEYSFNQLGYELGVYRTTPPPRRESQMQCIMPNDYSYMPVNIFSMQSMLMRDTSTWSERKYHHSCEYKNLKSKKRNMPGNNSTSRRQLSIGTSCGDEHLSIEICFQEFCFTANIQRIIDTCKLNQLNQVATEKSDLRCNLLPIYFLCLRSSMTRTIHSGAGAALTVCWEFGLSFFQKSFGWLELTKGTGSKERSLIV